MNAAAILPGSDADGYFDALQSQLSFPVIGSPQGCIFAANWFYDTNFHLNTAGRQANTRQLVRDIKAMRMDATPTVLPMPDMPALPAEGGQTPETAADDPDADCFVCELQSDGAAVTGLTDTGRTRTELTLPTRFQGRAVTSLAAGAFAGNTVIRQINVPGSFRTIADRSFAGCTALRVIRLQNRDPAACLVGQNLLADTSAELWVDADVLDAYKLHYFWAVYAGRLAAAPSGRG